MKDCIGNDIKIGDKVVYIADVNYNARLSIGTVDKIYSNDKECTVSGHAHVYGYRLMKII